MIVHNFLTRFDLDEAVVPLSNLHNLQNNEPKWYHRERVNLVYRLYQELDDDLEKCDPSVTRVCLDHMSWVECDFETDDIGVLISRTWEVKQKIEKILEETIARYPERLRQYHDDLRHDGVEIPVDVAQP